jgi:hypothetical protein
MSASARCQRVAVLEPWFSCAVKTVAALARHPPLNLVDVYAATIPTLAFAPAVHVNYAETVLPMRDGPAEAEGLPEGVRWVGRNGRGIARSPARGPGDYTVTCVPPPPRAGRNLDEGPAVPARGGEVGSALRTVSISGPPPMTCHVPASNLKLVAGLDLARRDDHSALLLVASAPGGLTISAALRLPQAPLRQQFGMMGPHLAGLDLLVFDQSGLGDAAAELLPETPLHVGVCVVAGGRPLARSPNVDRLVVGKAWL